MKSLILAAACAAAVLSPSLALAQSRAFDPRTYQDRIYGESTQILVLATPHLSGTPDTWDQAALTPLLDRLAAFRPDAILIEGLSGESIDALWRYREIYPQVATDYASRTMLLASLARTGVQRDMPDAEAEVRRTLQTWPAEPTAAQRRRLAVLFLASGDPNSALVQWWRLDPSERVAQDGMTEALLEQFDIFAARRNENHLIAARLAARLGLERVYPTDDHSADDTTEAFERDMETFYQSGWMAEIEANQAFTPLREAPSNLNTPDQVLATYRMLNAPATGRTDSDGQWLTMIDRNSPNLAGRARVAYWETRNLRQVAHIREVSALYPGRRLLVIVGSGHKPWFDAYLSMMTDVELVDARRVLR